ncbi:MAG: dephospho-CoA kinase, partial [Planctomycetota bacterium]
MYSSRPIIGIAGGIASGKTHVARLFGELGCMVISSDALVRTAYTHPAVKRAVMDMFGEEVFTPGGEVDRAAVGRAVFGDVEKRKQLEQLLHPIVNQVRLERMRAGAADPAVVAYVWDSPLLFETGLDGLCTAVVFVETPLPVRVARA